MLEQLTIKNFGLIDSLTVDFSSRLNILTGETGAGKSILIDALRIALGDRLNPTFIRDTTQVCSIEAIFDLANTPLLSDHLVQEFCSDDETQLIIARVYTPEGRTKCKINGTPITVTQLKQVGSILVDIHGPHDHQLLLQEDQHILLLDRLIDFSGVQERYLGIYGEYKTVCDSIQEIQSLTQSRDREMDILKYQLKELEQVSLTEDDYTAVVEQQVKVQNAQELHEKAREIAGLFTDDSAGVNERIRQGFFPLKQIQEIDEHTSSLSESLSHIQEAAEQFTNDIEDYLGSLSFDPQVATDVVEKYDQYEDIKRKYGPTITDAASFYEKARKRYDLLVNLEHNDDELKKKRKSFLGKLSKEAQKITQLRQDASAGLKKTIEAELRQLGIGGVKFEVKLGTIDFDETGRDAVSFFISPNVGEELKPLAQIVSSGEAARVMLALKKALVSVDPVPVLIFDEIDAQIGGRLGTITGRKLQEISQERQVIVITHLPQIASFAETHLKVQKNVIKKRTVVSINALDEQSRIQELADMMSGVDESSISLDHAQELVEKAMSS